MPRRDRFPRTALGASLLLHALLLLLLGTAWLQRPRTGVIAGKNAIAIEWIAPSPTEVQTAPVSQPKAERLIPAETPRPRPAEPVHPASSPSHGAREAHPDALHNPPPDYPEASREAREQGVVLIEVEVTASGMPAQVRLSRSSGFPRLDQAALRAVRGWKFEPATLGGIPVASRVEVPVRFELQ